MKLTLRPEWRLRPLSSFLGFLDIKTGVTIALLFAVSRLECELSIVPSITDTRGDSRSAPQQGCWRIWPRRCPHRCRRIPGSIELVHLLRHWAGCASMGTQGYSPCTPHVSGFRFCTNLERAWQCMLSSRRRTPSKHSILPICSLQITCYQVPGLYSLRFSGGSTHHMMEPYKSTPMRKRLSRRADQATI